MQKKPLCKIQTISKALKLSQPTVTASLMHLVNLKIIKEASGKQRDRMFIYEKYLDILREGT
jgi:Fic family protein